MTESSGKKIVFLGGGSTQFALALMVDFIQATKLYGSTIILVDLDAEKLGITTDLTRKLVETGKSLIFRGLSKLKPSDGEQYDGLKEFPRRRYTDEFELEDWPVASGCFLLEDREAEELSNICERLKDVKTATATRHYSWKLAVGFDPRPQITRFSWEELSAAVNKISDYIRKVVAPDGKGDLIGPNSF